MSEGSLDAPTRHPIDWQNPDFYDEDKLDAELRRVFDICHGCRRCFNLCDSFPRLFDLIDESKTGELDSVKSADFAPVVDACTLCDMCFMTKCPYVPPHEFDLDFPHLMLRYRAVQNQKGEIGFAEKQLSETDRNGRLAGALAPLANWASARGNALTRPALQAMAGVHKDAELPRYHTETLAKSAKAMPKRNESAPARTRKAAIYSTCFMNYNNPGTGRAALEVLAHNGVRTELVYPECCGMPQLEQGDLPRVAHKAKSVAAAFKAYVDDGYDIVSLTPSCSLMIKFEWPLICPEDEAVTALAKATRDISEYIVEIAKTEGLAEGLGPVEGGVSLHLACHSRAQNMGPKGAEMLRLIPDIDLDVIERCSGHGGAWGVRKDNFEVAMKVGKPVARKVKEAAKTIIASECPLAGLHIRQGVERLNGSGGSPPMRLLGHPIELIAQSYGLGAGRQAG